MKNRVVITGLGLVTPLGNDVSTSWNNLVAGRSGAGPITRFDASPLATQFAAEVKDFDVETYLSKKEARKFADFVQYGVAAAAQALEDSGYTVNSNNAHRVGVCIGSGLGGVETAEQNHQQLISRGPRRVSPFYIPGSIINMVAGQISIMYGIKGPNISIVTACTTGVHNIGHAARMIAYGDADAMLAGGAEMATTPLVIAGFNAAKALSTRNDDPQAASRPWDIDRDGFVLGEGAGVMMLESLESATARGATIYAEIKGFGMSGDAYHMTSPPEDGEGGALAMINAIQDAQMDASQIQYINAHGTSTPVGDVAEIQAVESVFADSPSLPMVSSTKSMTGHLLGAAGSVEAIFTALSVKEQVAPPTINLHNPEPRIRLDLVANQAKKANIENALCNSFGFGGTNGSLLIGKVD